MKTLTCAFVYLLLCAGNLTAQSGSGTANFTNSVFAENFDGFTSVSCPCNGMPSGWYVYDGVDDSWVTGTGTVATGNLYLLGTGADKSLGGVRTTVAPIWGVKVNNTTGATITSLRVQFTGESWRVVNRNTSDQLDFQYNIGGGVISDAPAATGWIDVNALDYRTLPFGGAAATTGAANSSLPMDYTITGISVLPGTTVFFRWIDADVSGADDATAIDDLLITANPSCGSGTTFISQDFEAPISSCWSASDMAVSGTNAIYNGASGRTSTAAAAVSSSADQVRANISLTGLYEELNSNAPSDLSWEFTVRTDLTGQAISTANFWGYFLYTNQSNLIGTINNTGYAVGVNLSASSDRTIKLYKLNNQRWDGVNTVLITSAYIYPGTAPTIIDRSVTIKCVRTGNNVAATWELFVNNVSQGTFADNSPVLPADMTTPSFTSGFFNAHNANRSFEIDDIMAYSGQRPCNNSSSSCRVASTLPLHIVSFKGVQDGETTTLDWLITDQTDTRTFEIEQSIDGITYKKIGTMPVSNTKDLYHFQAPHQSGSAYYRLKMTDHDGIVSYSEVVKITSDAGNKKILLISPNPVLGDVSITFSTYETGVLKVSGNTGQFLFQLKVNKQQQIRLNTRSLTKGNYTVTFISNSGTVLVSRFVKL